MGLLDRFTDHENEEKCDHEWVDKDMVVMHKNRIFHDENGYYLYENKVMDRVCDNCGKEDHDFREENRTYLKIRERIPYDR